MFRELKEALKAGGNSTPNTLTDAVPLMNVEDMINQYINLTML
jgi:hypothetical protein